MTSDTDYRLPISGIVIRTTMAIPETVMVIDSGTRIIRYNWNGAEVCHIKIDPRYSGVIKNIAPDDNQGSKPG